MATVIYPRQEAHHLDHSVFAAKAKLWLVPIGRTLFSLIFIFSGINHFSGATIGYALSQGVPLAAVLVPVSGAIAIVGGLSVLLGYHSRIGALALVLFLIPVTFSMHAFWAYTDPMMAQNHMAHFMKNMCLVGACLLIIFYGSGPVSIDHHQSVIRNRRNL